MYKKILAVALSATMALGLVGCGSTTSGTVKTDLGSIKLAEYKGLTAYEDDIKVTDSELQQTIDQDLSSHKTTEKIKKGSVKKDSSVVFNYTGKIESKGKKVAFDGGSATDQVADMSAKTVGGSKMIDGFVDALKGHKVGDTFTKKLNFPSNYTGTTTVNSKKVKLAVKSVWFTYKITALQKTNTPELNDEFVKKNYSSDKLTTVKAYKEYQKKELKYNKIMNGLWQDYVADCKVSEYNKEQLTQYESQAESQIVAQYSSYGIKDIKTYLEACSMSESDWHKQSKEAIKSRMVIYAIAKEEGLDGDKIYKSEGDAYAKKYYGADVKTLAKNYGESTVKDTLKLNILLMKVRDIICENVKTKKGSAPTTTVETTTAASTTAASTETTKAAETTKK